MLNRINAYIEEQHLLYNPLQRVLLAVSGANLIIGVVNTLNTVTRIGWLNLLVATLLMYVLGRIHGKKEALEKERELHE